MSMHSLSSVRATGTRQQSFGLMSQLKHLLTERAFFSIEAVIMVDWYRIKLSREEYESGELEILQGAFREAYIASNAPWGMALFGIWDDDGLHYLVYVTPASVRYMMPLLDAYSAEPHDPRNPYNLSLICGDESGRELLVC